MQWFSKEQCIKTHIEIAKHPFCAPIPNQYVQFGPYEPGFSTTQSTLKVTHRHGPCSALSQDKTTLTDLLSYDRSRVHSIRARLTAAAKMGDQKVELPAQPGYPLNTGNYIVSIGLGTPKKTLSLAFDTGSDLTWTQCQPCPTTCYKQQDELFDPSASTSYANISCSSPQCSQLTSATGRRTLCNAATCAYGIRYGDESFSQGLFVKDTLTLTPDDVFPDFQFGCGKNNTGLFGKTAGILGLGRNPLSLISQTDKKYGKYFSYCLPSSSSSTGHLTLGKSENSAKVKFTPFGSGSKASFYYIDIIGISVGGTQLQISQTVFQSTGSIIDSGTVITRLQPAAYSALRKAFDEKMTQYTKIPSPASLFDTCYDFGNLTDVTIPTVAFTFGGDLTISLDSSGILYVVGERQACLAFAANEDESDEGIFGNTQQKTFEVVYDVAGGNLGFVAGRCN